MVRGILKSIGLEYQPIGILIPTGPDLDAKWSLFQACTTAVTADFKLAAANSAVKNILFVGGIDATTGVVEVSAADCALIDTEYRDSTGQATDVIITTADADRL